MSETLSTYTVKVQNETDDQSSTGKVVIERGVKEIYQDFLADAYPYLVGSSSQDVTAVSGTALYTPTAFTRILSEHWKSTTSDTWCKLNPTNEDRYLESGINYDPGTPRDYFVKGTQVQLVPAPNEAGSIRHTYTPVIAELTTQDSLIPDRFTDVVKTGAMWKKFAYDNDPRASDYSAFYMSAKKSAMDELTQQQSEQLRPKFWNR